MKTILLPTDFSPASAAATRFVINLASEFKSSVIVLHVIESVDEASFNIEGEATASGSWEDRLFNMKMIEKARKQLAQVTASLIDNGINAKSLLRVGDAYHGIQAIVTEQKADLVVMGTEGSSGLQEIMVGSTTEKVVRRASCPVISVNRRSGVESLRSIVFATSLRNEDLAMPPVLVRMIEKENVNVHLVRINTPGLFIADHISFDKLREFARAMKLKRFTVNVYNDHTEEEGILRFAANVNADLIALSTHGRQGLAHLLNGSIAEDIVNHSTRPVMTFVQK